ncbi:MAG: glycosyltransferase [Candidatus Methanofastidiosum sp.]|nr:glycosyltransferase [Methanofastidiosum sp.]
MISDQLPYVSIIVVNYNGKHHISEFVESIKNLNYPKSRFELIIADNGSSDGSSNFIKKNYPWIRTIQFEKNYGFAEGNNLTVKYAKGEYIAFINNDTIVEKNWLSEMIKYAMIEQNAIYSSMMLRYDHRDIVVFCGSKLFAWGVPFSPHVYKFDYQLDIKEKIISFYADGCGMLLKKELFTDLGGFDKDYFAYAEDYDFSWKAWLYGYNVYCIPSSKFYHKISSTFGRRSSRGIHLLWRNNITNILKYTEAKNLFKIIFLHLIFSLSVYLALFIPEREYMMIFAIIKSYFSNIKNIRKIYRKRKIIQLNRTVSDYEISKIGIKFSLKESIKQNLKFIKRKKDFERGNMFDKRKKY